MTNKQMNKTTEALKLAEEAMTSNMRLLSAKALAAIRAAREQELNLNCKSVQKRLATSWGYVKAEQAEQDLDTCPGCGGVADNGHDREFPPNPYYCTKCSEQAEQEPMMDYERINALREGEQNGAEDAYFFVRPENDTPTLRKMFCQGFERGFHKGLKYASPVQQVDLTDDEIDGIAGFKRGKGMTDFARAVIKKFKEKNNANNNT